MTLGTNEYCENKQPRERVS